MQLTVLVDNNTIIDSYYLGEPAVSYWIDVDNKNILFDIGYSDVFIKNAEAMQVNIADTGYVVISHGHNDHTGGFQDLIDYYKVEETNTNTNIIKPTIIAHPDAFSHKEESGLNIGSPVSLAEIESHFPTDLSSTPVWITDKLVFLGAIERSNSFENKEHIGQCREADILVDDFVNDDSALVYKSVDGLVIITGCSHAGICNIIEYAKKVCKDDRVIDVIGGFHLLDQNKQQLDETLSYFKNLGAPTIHPCHCTSLQSKIDLSKYVPIEDVGVGMSLHYQ